MKSKIICIFATNSANMKVKLCAFMVVLMISSVVYAQRKRAFMVGISKYDTALTGYQWNNIHGVEDVNLLSGILKKQGFVLLTLLDEAATCDNIIRQLNQFISQTKKGDIVYLHFSTHGQPVEDLNGDEDDGWDEAIVPIDAFKLYKKGVYEGKKHILDDQLNVYVKRLRKKIGNTGFLYVVIDACHAGTASRANDDTIRGTHVGFTSNHKVFKPSTTKKSHYKIEASVKLSNTLFVEACRPDQVNSEIKVQDQHFGPLSFIIAQVLSNFVLSTKSDEFLKRIKKTIMETEFWPNNQNLVTETSY